MSKPPSSTLFQNSQRSQLAYSYVSPSYDSRPLFDSKNKKPGVKFQNLIDKENISQKNPNLSSSSHKSIDTLTKTWNGQLYSVKNQQSSKTELKELLSGYNQPIRSKNKERSVKLDSSIGVAQSSNLTFSSKNYNQEDRPKFKQQSSIAQKSFKQCKSMKTIPTFSQDDYSEELWYRPKNVERKYQKLQVYSDLLKQGENLIQKYKKLEEEKSKLRSDLKSQIKSNSKSSKKIGFLQETENFKQENTQKASQKIQNVSISFLQSKNYKTNDKNYPSKFNEHQTSIHESKYQLKLSKGSKQYSSSKNLNKTFSTSIKHMYPQQDLSYSKNNFNPSSSAGSFGVSKSVSSKKNMTQGLSLNDFQLGKCLGSGAFGQVFPAKHKKTGWIFALKKVPKQKVKYMLDQFITQIKIQLYLDHPNVVKLYSFFDDDLHFYILMEYMEGGSLYSYLKKQKTLNLQQTSAKLRQVCEGLQHMHENQVLHRDIKPQNIVMSHNVAKLCDFGWSTICKDRRTTYCGTLDYVCPQIIEGDGYDDSVDIWCIGVLAYELLVGKTPFFNISREKTMKKIIDCNLEYPASMPQIAVKFIKNILKKNPDHRQSIDQILKNPLLQISQKSDSLF